MKYALRYAAGYVIRALKKKLRISGRSNPMKKELELCLNEMDEKDKSECVDQSDMWTSAVDRRRLIHVSDMVFDVFASMKLTLRAYLKHRPEDMVELIKVKIRLLKTKTFSLVGQLLASIGVLKKEMCFLI